MRRCGDDQSGWVRPFDQVHVLDRAALDVAAHCTWLHLVLDVAITNDAGSHGYL